jgi:hypothetical protein
VHLLHAQPTLYCKGAAVLQHHGALLCPLMCTALALAAGVMVDCVEGQVHKLALILLTGGSHFVGLLITHHTTVQDRSPDHSAAGKKGTTLFTRILGCTLHRAEVAKAAQHVHLLWLPVGLLVSARGSLLQTNGWGVLGWGVKLSGCCKRINLLADLFAFNSKNATQSGSVRPPACMIQHKLALLPLLPHGESPLSKAQVHAHSTDSWVIADCRVLHNIPHGRPAGCCKHTVTGTPGGGGGIVCLQHRSPPDVMIV